MNILLLAIFIVAGVLAAVQLIRAEFRDFGAAAALLIAVGLVLWRLDSNPI